MNKEEVKTILTIITKHLGQGNSDFPMTEYDLTNIEKELKQGGRFR